MVDNFIYKPEEFNLAYYAGELNNFPIYTWKKESGILLKNDGKYVHFTRQSGSDYFYIETFNKFHFYIEKEKFKKMFIID